MGSQKGLVQRIERRLEDTVGDAFARVFGGSIVPPEVEAMLRREAAEGVQPVASNHLLAPNEYIITLGMHDFQKVGADPDLTSEAFAKHLARYISEQGWQTYGDVVVRFEQSSNFHTGQLRARGSVNPDIEPRSTVSELRPPESDHAFSAEPGVPPMTENSSYRPGQGQGRPGDDYYDDPHGGQQPDDPHGGQDPRGAYPPEPAGYPDQRGYPAPPADQGGYPDQRGYPAPPADQGGYPDQRGYPAPPADQGGYPDQRSYPAPPADQGGYPDQRSYPAPPADQGGYPDQRSYPAPPADQGGYPDQRGYPAPPADQGGYPDQRGYPAPPADQGGYPDQRGYPAPPADQGGYPDQRGYPAPPADQGGYPQYEQRPAPGYGGGQGYDAGYRQGSGYGQPAGQGYGEYSDYGRGPARQDESGYGAPDPRSPYPEQGGYDQGYAGAPGYGRQDYGQQPDYGRYGDAPGPTYAGASGGYPEPAGRDYDYGQPAEAGGYGGYGQQGGYSSSGAAVTLQLDDGSGRTYQLRDGTNIIGRGQDAQFRLPDTGVSRRHLEIRWDGQVALLSDLNSTNGTTVNNAPVQEWQLADGDVIRLGHSEIVVHIH
jgi:Protein of unknown function (DUF3662)/FHA domain